MADYDIYYQNQKIGPKTLSFGAADTSKTFTVVGHAGELGYGVIRKIVLNLPDWTNTVSATIAITNEDGDTLYSVATLAQNTCHYKDDVYVVVADTCTITVTLSGVPGGSGGDATVTLYSGVY